MIEPVIARRLNGERLVVLGWSRAILLQLAHPLIAAGVAEHSAFREGPLVAAGRLRATVRAMLSLTFGDAEVQAGTLATIRGIHQRVHGRLREAVGPYPAGTVYSAEDPALVTWVHVTLLQSIPLAYDTLVAPLAEGDWDRFGDESADSARQLGAQEPIPRTRAEVEAEVERMLAGGALAVGRDARMLADAVLRPLGGLAAPLVSLHRLMAIGWLPPVIREHYHLAWGARDEVRFDRWTRRLRAARALAPRWASRWQTARATD